FSLAARRQIAEDIATTEARSASVQAVLLVGSTASGEATTHSDIDLIVFTSDGQTPVEEHRWVAGVRVGIERLSSDYPRDLLSRLGITIATLRVMGRIVTGKVLFDRNTTITEMQTTLRGLRLSEADKLALLQRAEDLARGAR